ncbi:hypothetical protein HPP92_005093 [Vanilla planifolia]|uniref:TauD/TfdA-like domain-containing protein n=1 Tax=Vanilla planifolia TaxID=51239 RepID=A0A835RRJ2_VANPL|nr:hypothetical protein HPP92_005093 [Vanilla planifolia]
MAFLEGNMPTEKVFDGIVFPKTLFPAAGNRERLVEIVEAEKEHLGEYLRQHGALLLRGFNVRSADDFSRVLQAFGWKEFVYEGASNRTKLADRVLTVNTEPLHHFINFHHEMSLLREYPNKVIFCCIEAPPEGGETSIIPSDFVVKRMEEKVPKELEKLDKEGINVVMNAKCWRRMLDTEVEIEAEKRAMQKFICSSITFNDDGTVNFNYGPMSAVRELNGKGVIPQETIDAYNECFDEGCVDVKWQPGDVLVLDNLSVQHARRPGLALYRGPFQKFSRAKVRPWPKRG